MSCISRDFAVVRTENFVCRKWFNICFCTFPINSSLRNENTNHPNSSAINLNLPKPNTNPIPPNPTLLTLALLTLTLLTLISPKLNPPNPTLLTLTLLSLPLLTLTLLRMINCSRNRLNDIELFTFQWLKLLDSKLRI